MSIYDDVEKILYSKEDIQKRTQEVAREMNALYSDADLPLLVCNLKGAFMFLADLVRYLNFRHEIDFIETSSYGAATTSSGDVRFLLDVSES
ncbi:MAG: hypoxanthine phosphoribosyltransferase, partial [Chloroflexota bacterium]|nr:hypoxanthine phosphoribosyltransferase [Chloroflexota bacterium]